MKLLTILVFKGTCAPVAPPFKGQGGSASVLHPRSSVPANSAARRLARILLGLGKTTTEFQDLDAFNAPCF